MTAYTNMSGKRPDSHHVSTTIKGFVNWVRSVPNDTSAADFACTTLLDFVQKVRDAPMLTHGGQSIFHDLR